MRELFATLGVFALYVALALGVVAIIFVAFVTLFVLTAPPYSNRGKTLQSVNLPDGSTQFVLMGTQSAGDPSWWVYRMSVGESITEEMRENPEVQPNVLCWNYSEGGNHTKHARIEVRQDRYLVFSRGGLMHCLYDIAADSVLVNEPSPWDAAPFPETPPGQRTNEEIDVAIDQWVRENLDQRIKALLEDAA